MCVSWSLGVYLAGAQLRIFGGRGPIRKSARVCPHVADFCSTRRGAAPCHTSPAPMLKIIRPLNTVLQINNRGKLCESLLVLGTSREPFGGGGVRLSLRC